MLQLTGTLRNASVRITPMSSWRMPGQQLLAACSGAVDPSPVFARVKENKLPARDSKSTEKEQLRSNNGMVQAVFNSLKTEQFGRSNKSDAKTTVSVLQTHTRANVQGLLKIIDEKSITQEHAFAMVTLLINWVKNGKAKLSDFELDKKFLHLCDVLSKSEQRDIENFKNEGKTKKYRDELNLFYGINEIDEATKEVSNITLKQMMKVMMALARQKRRTTPLLRSLSFHISRSPDLLDIKQLSDLLYSMAILNYPDEILMQRICSDLMQSITEVKKSCLIGSILTSLGILRYKNEQLMDELSEWTVTHAMEMRPQDICSFFMTLAMLGYTPTNVESLKEVLIEPLKEVDMLKPADWLDVVWAFTVLDLADNRHIASVLHSNFIRKLEDASTVPMPKKHKLLNINGAAEVLLKNYEGPLLESNSEIFNASILRSKDKQAYAKCVIGALENIFAAPKYLKDSVDFGMGFLLDAEFCIDSKGNHLPIDSNLKGRNGLRIAVIALNYNDFCRGKQDRLGFHDFYFRILEAKGYTILCIPYTEFNPEDKAVQRVAYINQRIQSIVK